MDGDFLDEKKDGRDGGTDGKTEGEVARRSDAWWAGRRTDGERLTKGVRQGRRNKERADRETDRKEVVGQRNR